MTLPDFNQVPMNSTQAQMCYQVHTHLGNVRECLAELQDQSLYPEERMWLLDLAEKRSRAALQLCEALFQSIATEDSTSLSGAIPSR